MIFLKSIKNKTKKIEIDKTCKNLFFLNQNFFSVKIQNIKKYQKDPKLLKSKKIKKKLMF